MTGQTSLYSRVALLGDNEVDIAVFRDGGARAWQLQLKVNGNPVDVPRDFVSDKAAYDAALVRLKQLGLDITSIQADEFGIIDSPLSVHRQIIWDS